MAKSRLELDVSELVSMIGGEWNSYSVDRYEDESMKQLQRARYERDFRHVSAVKANDIYMTMDNGKKVFGVSIIMQEKRITVVKESKTRIIFFDFDMK